MTENRDPVLTNSQSSFMRPTDVYPVTNRDPVLTNSKRLKVAAYICLAISFGVALSGKIFISSYDISTYNTSVIEAALMQVAHLRYVSATVLALIGAVFFSTSQLMSTIILYKGEPATITAAPPAPTFDQKHNA